jgi:Heterokaryon incompatibility protein (HET)
VPSVSEFGLHALADNQFDYTPLVDIHSIRLLLIQPAPKGNQILLCSIVHDTLSNSINYTALSYVWGQTSGTTVQRRTIWIDQKQALIGPNLYDALLHLRDEREPVLIWADAICINQLDLRERNHQVLKMREIYSKAETTVIYLGADDGGNTLKAAWNFLENEGNDRMILTEGLATDEFNGDIGDVEISVLSRSWFRRVWVFQEIIVSKRPLMQCGWRQTTWDTFCKAVLLQPRVNDRYGWSLSKKPLVQYVADMFHARCAFLKEHDFHHLLPPWFDKIQDNIGKGAHILTTLSRARRLESSDPRDKVYAVLGVSSEIDITNDRIAVDYSKTVEQVYTDLAQYMIYSTSSYDILSCVGRRLLEQGNPAPQWGSWIADWRVPLGPPRTILSILGRESPDVQDMRKVQVMLNHSWVRNTLSCVGRAIARIKKDPIPINLSEFDELMFEKIRNANRDNEAAQDREILRLWEIYPFEARRRSDKSSTKPKAKWPNFHFRLPKIENASKEWIFKSRKGKERWRESDQQISHSKGSELDKQDYSDESEQAHEITLEKLLLLRSRATGTGRWDSDTSSPSNIVIDETSVLEGRSLANIGGIGLSLPEHSSAALVPINARKNDFIVALKGGRLPFVVRIHKHLKIKKGPVLRLAECELIGECFVNGYKKLDCVYTPKIAANGWLVDEFAFGPCTTGILSQDGRVDLSYLIRLVLGCPSKQYHSNGVAQPQLGQL